MEISNVELIHYDEIKPGTEVDGLPVPARPETYGFKVTAPDQEADLEVIVPNDPSNPHYQAVVAWYDEQTTKPFDFDFVRTEPGTVLPVLDASDPQAARPVVAAHQEAAAELPDFNLTDEQTKELNGQ